MGLAVGGACLGAACLEPPARACQRDEECQLDERRGECGGPGYCIYPSEQCESGVEFGPFAGEGLAGQCVEGEVAATGGTTGDDAGDNADTDATDDGSEGGGPTTSGATDGSEGTGAESLEVWQLVRIAVDGPGVALGGVDESLGRIAVVGTDTGDSLIVAAVDGDSVAWTFDATLIDAARGEAVAVNAAGEVWVAGNRTLFRPDSARPYVARIAADGTLQWSTSWDTLGRDWLAGAGVDDVGNATAVGVLDDEPWLLRLDPDGNLLTSQQWSADVDGLTPVAASVSAGGLSVLAGPNAGSEDLRLVNSSGVVLLQAPAPISAGQTVSKLDAGPTAITLMGDTWLVSADYEAQARWSVQTEATQLSGLAVDGQGRTFVVGDGGGATVLWSFDADGAPGESVTVIEGSFSPAVVTVDDAGLVVATAASDAAEIVIWAVRP